MTAWFTLLLCSAIAIVTHLSLRDPALKQRLIFDPFLILVRKEWWRLFSSSLIHADWRHAGFNLFSLYLFGSVVENLYGAPTLIALYVLSVLGGDALSLYLHRNHQYSALGASGGVCGVIFGTIFLVPGIEIGDFIMPFGIPGNIYAVAYLVVTFCALRKGIGSIGHDAHFGGAVVGIVFAFSIRPQLCLADPLYFWGSIVFSSFCLYTLFTDPLCLSGKILPSPIRIRKPKRRKRPTGDIRYDSMIEERERQGRIDAILDKISQDGFDSLSPDEQAILQRHSNNIANR